MSPVFAHGQLRLYLLALLEQGPRHGYEVIQDLEQRFDGLYSPSAGTVYPRLAKLEQEGLVARTDEGRKATYRITDAGRDEVAARRGDLDDLHLDLERSARDLAQEVRRRVQGQSADLRAELAAAARAARAGATTSGRAADPTPDPPASGGWGGIGWPWNGGGAWPDLERVLGDLRLAPPAAGASSGGSGGSGGLTAQQVAEVAAILAEASRRIGEVLRRGR